MSRIGKKIISIPESVSVNIEKDIVKVHGPKGDLSFELRPEIAVKLEDNHLVVSEKLKTNNSVAFWGMTRARLANMVTGVVSGFDKKLELVGVGYRAKASGSNIIFNLGYSKPVEFTPPHGIQISVESDTVIVVKGIDKEVVGQTAALIRKLRKPEPYKGKGIRYSGEIVRRKPGKSTTKSG